MLEKKGMLVKKGTPNGTTLTIVNYEFYQGEGTTKRTTQDTQKKKLKKLISKVKKLKKRKKEKKNHKPFHLFLTWLDLDELSSARLKKLLIGHGLNHVKLVR